MNQCLFLVTQDVTNLRGEYFVRAAVAAETSEHATKAVLALSQAQNVSAERSRLSAVRLGTYEPQRPVEAVCHQQSALILCWQAGADDGL